MGDRPREITLVVRVEIDPSVFHNQSDGIVVLLDMVGRPVIGLRDLTVDEYDLGATVLTLLAEQAGGEAP